jgi:DNA-binding MarR family transcriptional regulator/GNAT superfamily N-acetyltransferase
VPSSLERSGDLVNQQIADIRAFNRFYTRQIGLLNEHFNQSRFSLPEGRVLYEIASRGHTTLAEVARALDMDLGYASRLVRKLVGDALIAVTPSGTDRRSNTLALTREGTKAFGKLDAVSNAAVGDLLEPIDPLRREALLDAMRTVRTVLGDIEPGPVILRPHRLGELGWMIHRQGLLYNQQYGWNGAFEALIARIYNEYEASPTAPPRNLWVAEWNGAVAGSIFCMPSEGLPGSAQLRMLYVEPVARGQGIGRLLVEECVGFARDAGYERMRLWTHSIQVAARKLYAGAGFEIVEEWDHESFGKQLHAEIWEMRF